LWLLAGIARLAKGKNKPLSRQMRDSGFTRVMMFGLFD
jgi:hypothetical protein